MISFALKSLRHRKAAFAGAFLALFCAAALVCACGMLLETGLRGKVATERWAATPLIVAGDQFVRETVDKGDGETKEKAKPLADRRWIPASLVTRLEQVPGVKKVIPEVTFVHGGAVGHGWESAALTPFTIAQGKAPTGPREVVVDARSSLKPGDKLGAHTVVGVTAQALPSQDTVFFSTAEARRLAGHESKVSAIGVFPAVRLPAMKDALAYTGDERGPIEFLNAEQARVKLISLGGALGGTSLLVAILVVVGTFALSIQQRQRELALLRAVAATPKQVRSLIGGEALMVSAAAGVLGALAGLGLGFWLRAQFVRLGAMPENLPLVVSPFPIFAALLATVGAAWAAARLSARRTARIRPVEALGEAARPTARLPWIRILLGLVMLAGAVTLTAVLSGLSVEAASSPVTMLTALVWVFALSILGPLVTRAAITLVPLQLGRKSGYLAARSLRANARRLASVVVPMALMIAMACTILFVQTTMEHAASAQAEAGVKAPTEILRTSVRIGLEKYSAQAAQRPTLDLGVVDGRLDPAGMAVSDTAAERLGVRPGDRVGMTLGDGTPVTLAVSAIYSRGLAFGDLHLPYPLLKQHVEQQISAKPANAEVNYVAMGLIIAFTMIAMVNTLSMSTSERSRELALLRLVGTTKRQVLRMLKLETLTAVLIATVTGTAIAVITLSAFSLGMTGSAVPYIAPVTYACVIAAAAALALAATVIPARLVLRRHPADAVASRE
ncbi:FtsX-like permease family protein [Streptosporangium sp. NPDC000396]|uniref:ABC transporter permease n=1 Tax=Streptosporangium sp. NPDC000396 TaxID=3366185 RepID=UPI0036BB4BF8